MTGGDVVQVKRVAFVSTRISGSDGGGVIVTMADLHQANGMMHVIDGVLLPED